MNDRTGEKYGYYTVISLDYDKIPEKSGRHYYWMCECECGSIRSVRSTSLKKLTHCGCKPNQDLIGQMFGKMLVVEFGGFDTRYDRHRPQWICRCSGCNIERPYVQELLLRGDIKTCGKPGCRPRGKHHANYNPYSDRYNRRDSTEYKAWNKNVFRRDKFTCRCCNKKNKKINAHHLDGWNWCIERRFDVSNGVTLCAGRDSCHSYFHKLYGNGNNTKFQFDEFMSVHSIYGLNYMVRKTNGRQ